MRSYPSNSPEAAARIVALVLISDGHVSQSEVQALAQSGVEPSLGLAPGQFSQIIHTLCEDLLAGAQGQGSMMCSVDDATLNSLLAEVSEPTLRQTVRALAQLAAEADRHLAHGEDLVLAAMRRLWGAANEPLQPAWRSAA